MNLGQPAKHVKTWKVANTWCVENRHNIFGFDQKNLFWEKVNLLDRNHMQHPYT